MNLPAASSKTVQLSLVFAVVGALTLLTDRAIIEGTGAGLRYVPEFFAMLSAMFLAVAGKNASDNWTNTSRANVIVNAQSNPPPVPGRGNQENTRES